MQVEEKLQASSELSFSKDVNPQQALRRSPRGSRRRSSGRLQPSVVDTPMTSPLRYVRGPVTTDSPSSECQATSLPPAISAAPQTRTRRSFFLARGVKETTSPDRQRCPFLPRSPSPEPCPRRDVRGTGSCGHRFSASLAGAGRTQPEEPARPR